MDIKIGSATTIIDNDDDDVDDIVSVTEQLFHNTVRENIIFLLLFLLLYLGSYALVKAFRRHDKDDLYSTDDDEILVYRISLWLCTFSLAIAIGAALLLPISIASNEVLLFYPQSYYVKWLNSSLIHGLWNYIFLFSNCALFILLPFSYLFAESTGFYGYRKGIISRVYETLLVFSILAVVVIGLTYLLAAVFDSEKSQIQTILNLGTYHLSFLYSCISFLGVILLLVCTPLGFIHLFGIVNQILVKPHLLRDIDEELRVFHLEEACVKRKLDKYKSMHNKNNSNNYYYNNNGIFMNTTYKEKQFLSPSTSSYKDFLLFRRYKISALNEDDNSSSSSSSYNKLEITYNNNKNNNSNNTFSNSFDTTVNSSADKQHIEDDATQILDGKKSELIQLNKRLSDLNMERKELYKLSSSSSFQRNVIYPTAMLLLLFLTGITVLIVLLNTLGILFGIKSLPLLKHHQHHHLHHHNYEHVDDEYQQQQQQTLKLPIDETQTFTLGITSLSQFGSIGATIEIFIILYLGITSLVGLYTIPILKYIQPKLRKTSLSQLIVNCTLVLILSSALPLLSRMLGITNFDLLGDFGAIEWLGNFQIVFIYNLIFGATTALCLFKKFTSIVWSFW